MALEFEIDVDGKDLAASLSLDRQIEFAASAAATETAIEATSAVIEKIQQEFDVTNQWYLPSNLYGIHFTPASPKHPTASVHTNAWWLVPHETGTDKKPSDGEYLAVPTKEIKQPHQAIPRAKRPRNLVDSFLLETKRGLKLFQRKLNNKLVLAYNFVRGVKVKKRSTVVEPTVRTVEQKFGAKFSEKLKEALRTAK